MRQLIVERERLLWDVQENKRHLIDEDIKKWETLFKQFQNAEKLTRVADDIGDAFGDAALRAIEDWKNLGDVLVALFKDIQRAILQELVARPLAQQVSSWVQSFAMAAGPSLFGGGGGRGPVMSTSAVDNILSAPSYGFGMGGVINSGRIDRYGAGGIASRPTYFGMAGGRTGLMGEAGPEGIFQLARDSRGRLGVRDVGGGGSTTINNSWHIETPNVDGFRRSKRQIEGQLARSMVRGV